MQARSATYLDFNAGVPPTQAVLEELLRFFSPSTQLVGNPSSIHAPGRRGRRLLSDAREQVATSIGARIDSERVVFTSSGTEANQTVIRSVLEPRLSAGRKTHWITTSVEHDSVRQMTEWVRARGGEVSVLPVSSEGQPSFSDLAQLIRPETALISAIWVNNETGVVSDLSTLVALARSSGVAVHVDAAQAWGKLKIDVDTLGADYVTFSGHKIGGLAGTGALWYSNRTQVGALILGKQERALRGGTENLIGAVSVGLAANRLNLAQWTERVGTLQTYFEEKLIAEIPGLRIAGLGAPRVANTTNIVLESIEGEGLVMGMDLAGYAVSAGSACSSGVLEPSHVLTAMGYSSAQAMAALRISTSESTTLHDLDGFVMALSLTLQRMRKASQSKDRTSHVSFSL